MIDAFLFDLDGTLLDSEILWVEAIWRTLADEGCEISDAAALKLVYGRAWSDIRDEILRLHPGAFPTSEALERRTGAVFRELASTRDIRIPSSIDLLKRLASGFPVAIVSGSTRSVIAEGMALMGIAPWVKLYVGVEDYGPGKPDPACFLIAAERLGVKPATCLVFEDSSAGVRAAKAAGMVCVALQRPGRPRQDVSAADEILSDLAAFRLDTYRPRP
jgi:sugar-phosphatase